VCVNDIICKLSASGRGCHVAGICVGVLMYADDLLLISSTCSDLRRMPRTVFSKPTVYNTVTFYIAVFFLMPVYRASLLSSSVVSGVRCCTDASLSLGDVTVAQECNSSRLGSTSAAINRPTSHNVKSYYPPAPSIPVADTSDCRVLTERWGKVKYK